NRPRRRQPRLDGVVLRVAHHERVEDLEEYDLGGPEPGQVWIEPVRTSVERVDQRPALARRRRGEPEPRKTQDGQQCEHEKEAPHHFAPFLPGCMNVPTRMSSGGYTLR